MLFLTLKLYLIETILSGKNSPSYTFPHCEIIFEAARHTNRVHSEAAYVIRSKE